MIDHRIDDDSDGISRISEKTPSSSVDSEDSESEQKQQDQGSVRARSTQDERQHARRDRPSQGNLDVKAATGKLQKLATKAGGSRKDAASTNVDTSPIHGAKDEAATGELQKLATKAEESQKDAASTNVDASPKHETEAEARSSQSASSSDSSKEKSGVSDSDGSKEKSGGEESTEDSSSSDSSSDSEKASQAELPAQNQVQMASAVDSHGHQAGLCRAKIIGTCWKVQTTMELDALGGTVTGTGKNPYGRFRIQGSGSLDGVLELTATNSQADYRLRITYDSQTRQYVGHTLGGKFDGKACNFSHVETPVQGVGNGSLTQDCAQMDVAAREHHKLGPVATTGSVMVGDPKVEPSVCKRRLSIRGTKRLLDSDSTCSKVDQSLGSKLIQSSTPSGSNRRSQDALPEEHHVGPTAKPALRVQLRRIKKESEPRVQNSSMRAARHALEADEHAAVKEKHGLSRKRRIGDQLEGSSPPAGNTDLIVTQLRASRRLRKDVTITDRVASPEGISRLKDSDESSFETQVRPTVRRKTEQQKQPSRNRKNTTQRFVSKWAGSDEEASDSSSNGEAAEIALVTERGESWQKSVKRTLKLFESWMLSTRTARHKEKLRRRGSLSTTLPANLEGVAQRRFEKEVDRFDAKVRHRDQGTVVQITAAGRAKFKDAHRKLWLETPLPKNPPSANTAACAPPNSESPMPHTAGSVGFEVNAASSSTELSAIPELTSLHTPHNGLPTANGADNETHALGDLEPQSAPVSLASAPGSAQATMQRDSTHAPPDTSSSINEPPHRKRRLRRGRVASEPDMSERPPLASEQQVESMMLAPQKAPLEVEAENAKFDFEPGARVRCHGLERTVEYNGMHGVIQHLRDSGRWRVKLDNGKQMNFKVENLKAELDDSVRQNAVEESRLWEDDDQLISAAAAAKRVEPEAPEEVELEDSVRQKAVEESSLWEDADQLSSTAAAAKRVEPEAPEEAEQDDFVRRKAGEESRPLEDFEQLSSTVAAAERVEPEAPEEVEQEASVRRKAVEESRSLEDLQQLTNAVAAAEKMEADREDWLKKDVAAEETWLVELEQVTNKTERETPKAVVESSLEASQEQSKGTVDKSALAATAENATEQRHADDNIASDNVTEETSASSAPASETATEEKCAAFKVRAEEVTEETSASAAPASENATEEKCAAYNVRAEEVTEETSASAAPASENATEETCAAYKVRAEEVTEEASASAAPASENATEEKRAAYKVRAEEAALRPLPPAPKAGAPARTIGEAQAKLEQDIPAVEVVRLLEFLATQPMDRDTLWRTKIPQTLNSVRKKFAADPNIAGPAKQLVLDWRAMFRKSFSGD